MNEKKVLIILLALALFAAPVLTGIRMIAMKPEGQGSYIVWASETEAARYGMIDGHLVKIEELDIEEYPLSNPWEG